MVSPHRQEPGSMSSPQERPNELAVLMELRMAFGPGTRLWSLTSREEICYDWLHFKARRLNASFRDFALWLYRAEKSHSPSDTSLYELRRRVAIALPAQSHQEVRGRHLARSPCPAAGASRQPQGEGRPCSPAGDIGDPDPSRHGTLTGPEQLCNSR